MTRDEAIITICIPTFNRGELLLKNLKEYMSQLNEQCPLLIIDNGSTRTQEAYKEIKKISKSHPYITYVRQPENTEFIGNIIESFRLVSTQFLMFVSDEDTPNISFIEDNYEFFLGSLDIACIRTSTECLTDGIERINAWVFDDEELDPGMEALTKFAVSGNYLSGQIYNAKLLKSSGIVSALIENKGSQYYYPHMYLNMKCAARYKTKFTSAASVYLGKANDSDFDGSQNAVSGYFGAYSFGNRLDQFISVRDALLECTKDIDNENFDPTSFYVAYLNVVGKFMQMITLSNYDQYINHGLGLNLLTQSFSQFALSAVKQFPLYDQIEKALADDIRGIEEHFLDRSNEICNPNLHIDYYKRNFMLNLSAA